MNGAVRLSRLLAGFLFPTVLVGVGMNLAGDVRLAFLLYVFGGCLLGPWIFLGIRPGGAIGLPPWSHGPRARTILVAQLLVLGPVLALTYYYLIPWLGDPADSHQVLLDMGWNDAHRRVYALIFLLCVPLAEEWWWRGKAQFLAETRWGRERGRWISALAFSLYHAFVLAELYPAGGVVLRMGFIVVGGRFWAEISGRWGWRMAYAGHFAADVAIVAVYLIRLP